MSEPERCPACGMMIVRAVRTDEWTCSDASCINGRAVMPGSLLERAKDEKLAAEAMELAPALKAGDVVRLRGGSPAEPEDGRFTVERVRGDQVEVSWFTGVGLSRCLQREEMPANYFELAPPQVTEPNVIRCPCGTTFVPLPGDFMFCGCGRRWVRQAWPGGEMWTHQEASKPAPAIAGEPVLRPGDVVSHRGSGRGGGTVTHTYHGGSDVAVAWPDGYRMDYPAETLSLERPTPAIAAEPVVGHLGETLPGRSAETRAVCGAKGVYLAGEAEFSALSLAARCPRCDSNFRGRQLEANDLSHPRPSAAASAPAARPRLTIACQSQWDPDD